MNILLNLFINVQLILGQCWFCSGNDIATNRRQVITWINEEQGQRLPLTAQFIIIIIFNQVNGGRFARANRSVHATAGHLQAAISMRFLHGFDISFIPLRSVFLRVWLTIYQRWFRWCLYACSATNPNKSRRWHIFMTHVNNMSFSFFPSRVVDFPTGSGNYTRDRIQFAGWSPTGNALVSSSGIKFSDVSLVTHMDAWRY